MTNDFKPHLGDFTFAQLTDFVKSHGLPAFRAKQIFSWLYRPLIEDFTQMTDLGKQLRGTLAALCRCERLALGERQLSADGTVKYAFRLTDGAVIESVLIPEGERLTLCISSQVGCAMGCRFCLTGTMGLTRNLTPAEIVGQVLMVNDDLAAGAQGRVNNLVFMGMGEPLANLAHVLTALEILLDPNGLDFSDRKVTVSTCGLVPRLAELGEKSKVNLAISLHAVSDRQRSQIMPVNETYPVDLLLAACRQYPLPNRKRIMIEYVLLREVNDSAADAKALAKKLHGLPCKINLLPYNENPALPFRTPEPERVEQFQRILRAAGYTVLLRTSRGADISAACGQLAHDAKANGEKTPQPSREGF